MKLHKPIAWLLSSIVSLTLTVPVMVVAGSTKTLKSVRMHEAPDSTRVVFDTDQAVAYKVFSLTDPYRVVVDLQGVAPLAGFDPAVVAVGRERVSNLRAARRNADYRVVIDTKRVLTPKAFTLAPIAPYGHRLVIDLFDPRPAQTPSRAKPAAENRDVVIAIDAGHGGDDPGAIGPKKIQEKHVVLQIARRVERQITTTEGFRAVLVRSGDYYLPHRKRTQFARDQRADLFVSVHADAFKQANVKGASVYSLSDRGASSETAQWLAERENRSDLLGGVGHVSLTDKDPVLAHVLLDLSMDANRSQSIDAGEAVLANLGRVTKLHKRRVEQAAFVVLKSPDMPSILVETGFISNPDEARRLSQAEHQNKLAGAIAAGIKQFMRSNPPPGTRLAASKNLHRNMRYTIVRGDTLSTIAMRYGISSRILKSRNGLNNDHIKVGQVLLIPGV